MCTTGRSISPSWHRSRYPLVKFSNNFTACRYNAEARESTINEERPTPSLVEKFDPGVWRVYTLNLSCANRCKNHNPICYGNLFHERLISRFIVLHYRSLLLFIVLYHKTRVIFLYVPVPLYCFLVLNSELVTKYELDRLILEWYITWKNLNLTPIKFLFIFDLSIK